MLDFGDSIFIDPAAPGYIVKVNASVYVLLAALRVVFIYLLADSVLIAEFVFTTSQHSG